MPSLAFSNSQLLAQDTSRLTANSKQEQILQGALRIFLSAGYAATSMDRVAAEAKVSKQTIYSHFQDKQGLFKALMEYLTIHRMQSALGTAPLQGEPEVWLRQFAQTYLFKVADDPHYQALLRVIIGESARFPKLANLYTQTVIQQGRQILCDYFVAHPELAIKDPEAIAHIFLGSLVSFVVVQEILYGKELLPLDRDRVIESLMQVLHPAAKEQLEQ
jgi:AcrR family transcriptional regulator